MTLKLKECRERAGISQKDFAKALGVKLRTYGSWERGEVTMNVDWLLTIASALDCSTDSILGREVSHQFDDPMEEALHATWENLEDLRRRGVLKYAQEQLALQQLGGRAQSEDGPSAGVVSA